MELISRWSIFWTIDRCLPSLRSCPVAASGCNAGLMFALCQFSEVLVFTQRFTPQAVRSANAAFRQLGILKEEELYERMLVSFGRQPQCAPTQSVIAQASHKSSDDPFSAHVPPPVDDAGIVASAAGH